MRALDQEHNICAHQFNVKFAFDIAADIVDYKKCY